MEELAVFALSFVHIYMEDQHQRKRSTVYHAMSIEEGCVNRAWLALVEDHEEMLAEQAAILYVDYDLEEDIAMSRADCRAMQGEADELELGLDGVHYDTSLQKVHAFYLAVAIGLLHFDIFTQRVQLRPP